MSTKIDDIIAKLLAARDKKPGTNVNLGTDELTYLLEECAAVLTAQPALLELEAPIQICGDIHGQYSDLLRLFEHCGFPPDANYLFLGDYVDRGKNGLECVALLMAYKVKYPENFFMLRGNHECASINRIYGFYDECKRRYNIKMWKKFQDVFNVLPFAAIVDEKIFCVHAGLSPDLNSPEQIKRISRPTDVPDSGLLCDLLWSDPELDVTGWAENDRGVSYTFGADVVGKFLAKARLRPGGARAPGGGGRLRVLRRPAAGHHLLGAQLLRRVRQRRRGDGGRREPDVLLPYPEACGEAEVLRLREQTTDATA